MCVRIRAPRKSMQRYYFFSKPPNNQQKKCHFSAKIVHFSLLFSFCYFDFAKFTLILPFFSSPPFCHKSTYSNHLYTFSTTYFSLLKNLFSLTAQPTNYSEATYQLQALSADLQQSDLLTTPLHLKH